VAGDALPAGDFHAGPGLERGVAVIGRRRYHLVRRRTRTRRGRRGSPPDSRAARGPAERAHHDARRPGPRQRPGRGPLAERIAAQITAEIGPPPGGPAVERQS
jgi:hypothetical protein